jgi:hypothetical protein
MIATAPKLSYPVLPLLAVLFFCLCWGLFVWKRKRRRAKELAGLRGAWGKPVDRPRDFAFYPSFLKARNEADELRYLDDHTWRDLNLDLVFAHLDRTYSLPGEIELYCAMRVRERTPEVLEARDEMISLFQSDVTAREDIQLQLSRLGRTLFDLGILELLWGQLPPRSRFAPLYPLLAMLVMTSVALSILLRFDGLPYGTFAFVSLSVLYVINFLIHYGTRRTLGRETRAQQVHPCGAFFFSSLPASAGILFATTFTWWCEVRQTFFSAGLQRVSPAEARRIHSAAPTGRS